MALKAVIVVAMPVLRINLSLCCCFFAGQRPGAYLDPPPPSTADWRWSGTAIFSVHLQSLRTDVDLSIVLLVVLYGSPVPSSHREIVISLLFWTIEDHGSDLVVTPLPGGIANPSRNFVIQETDLIQVGELPFWEDLD